MQANYLESIRVQFDYYRMLGERTIEQLEEEDLFWQYNPESNSIAIIVNHLSGNMKSRWTDFLTTDGEKDFRNREQEFEDVLKTKADMIFAWNEGWDVLTEALNSVNPENFDTIVYIRNMGHTITEAINRQMAHYAYHIGQMVYIGRMIKGANWQSLSIPKGKSQDYNKEKFSKPKHREHFTKEFLEGEKE